MIHASTFLTFFAFAQYPLFASTGNVLSCCGQHEEDPPAEVEEQHCHNRPHEGEQWACEKECDMPTVDCIVKDMILCGIDGQDGPTVFYSFGAPVKDVRINVRDKLAPKKGVMFNDGLIGDQDWATKVLNDPKYEIKRGPRIMDDGNPAKYMDRENVFVARYSQALAILAKGDVYFAYKTYNGEGGGGRDGDLGGIWQLPSTYPPEAGEIMDPNRVPNPWRTWELPTLLTNEEVQRIIGVSDEVYEGKQWNLDNKRVEFERGKLEPKQLQRMDADELDTPKKSSDPQESSTPPNPSAPANPQAPVEPWSPVT